MSIYRLQAIPLTMTSDDFCDLDFGEIAMALAATPHSRRMMGLILACHPNIKDGKAVAEACWSPEFVEAALDTQNEDAVFVLLARNELPPERVLAYAQETVSGKGWLLPFTVGEFALGSPLLGDNLNGLLETLSEKRGKEKKLVNGFTFTAFGNPLLHGSDKDMDENSFSGAKESHRFLLSAATFGNLSNPHIAEALQYGVLGGGRDASAVINALVHRQDVPKDLIVAMGESATGLDDCRAVANMPGHRSLVRSKECNGLVGNNRRRADAVRVISPEAKDYVEERARNLLSEDNESTWMTEAILRSEHCPKDYYEANKQNGDAFLSSYDFLRDSPWAREQLLSMRGRNGFSGAGIFLMGKGNDKARLQFWSLPAMPVEQMPPSCVSRMFKDKHLIAAHIAGASRCSDYAYKLSRELKAPEHWHMALLFSAATSGRRLEQIAKAHPEVAGLAALHPNGDDLPMALVPEKFHSFVDRHRRAAPSLQGKGKSSGVASAGQIVL